MFYSNLQVYNLRQSFKNVETYLWPLYYCPFVCAPTHFFLCNEHTGPECKLGSSAVFKERHVDQTCSWHGFLWIHLTYFSLSPSSSLPPHPLKHCSHSSLKSHQSSAHDDCDFLHIFIRELTSITPSSSVTVCSLSICCSFPILVRNIISACMYLSLSLPFIKSIR